MILALLVTLSQVHRPLSMAGKHTLSLAKCFIFLQHPLPKKGTVDVNEARLGLNPGLPSLPSEKTQKSSLLALSLSFLSLKVERVTVLAL